MMTSEMRRMRELEQENARLNNIAAVLWLYRKILLAVIKRKLVRRRLSNRWRSAGPP